MPTISSCYPLQASPVEAVYRLTRLSHSKQQEPPPGYESTAHGYESNSSVKDLMRLQHAIGAILRSIARTPELRVAFRKFNLKRYAT